MKPFDPGNYRKGSPQERAASAEYARQLKGDKSRVRRLVYLPHVRVINVMRRYRLLSLNEGRTWELLNHNEYVKRIRRCYR
ncbi:hypothetical protein QSW73_004547 [Salmonella enterica]|nr:hypothetical protein [Salmonella enterica]ELQ3455673.1 hypothetical protein [Salmonella enterica]